MRYLVTAVLSAIAIFGFSQNKTGYVIYNSKGKKVSYKKMVKSLSKADVTCFGEFHDNPISHWLELELTKDYYQKVGNCLLLGAEMVERDNQDELDLYLFDSINQKAFDTLARLWPNYKTDYKPLVDFAKDSGVHFCATNIPRRYASLVYKKDFAGLDSLSNEEKSWIAPLPITFDSSLPQYQKILEMMGGHGSSRLVKAQAIKDATMAYFIIEALKANASKTTKFLHFNGSFHTDFHEGIVWYLNQYAPEISVKTIATVSQSDVSKLDKEHRGRADFIICVDEDMTSTY
ncbi:MAG: ChaN family lipoprotein [Flavobacteriales bacterium]|nr:ChaN family lipoprotein [Flavobacteriales bacterium]